ncbi:TetR/AcrR family transcriptional regulator [Streptomyces sp. NBC_00306]|uniref:TetR/AcrR family transcriptional regulator n=1 Tax=Streptomyces sp. NBC_00306 TaxID=2975708 RepID=UPI002E28A54B|nr:TetR family transcriptional regulator [Streptomyces sp. NBC_00306]
MSVSAGVRGAGRPGGGRRPGHSNTRALILTAALELFAAKGYAGATLRGIAERADVDPALIHHFFDNKGGLFRHAVASRIDLSTLFGSLTDKDAAGPKNRGEWIARTFLSYWEDESTRPALVAVFRTGLADEPVAKEFHHHIERALASCLARLAPEKTARTPELPSLVSAHLVGLVMLRYVCPMEPLASLDFEELMTLLARAIDILVDEPRS